MNRRGAVTGRRWALAAGWNVAVLAASFDALSAAHTGSILEALLHAIAPSTSPSAVAAIHFAVRKLAHVTEYGILSALYAQALRRPEQAELLLRWRVIAVSICAATAAIDEWHQSFVPSRTGSPRDVAIDVFGAILVQLLWALWRWRGSPGALES